MKLIKIPLILLTIFALFVNNEYSYCGIKQIPKYISKSIWIMLSNPYVQKWGSTALFIYGQGICDAKVDGWSFDNLFGDKITYGVSDKNWHSYKNIGKLTTWSAVGLMTLGVGQKHFTIKETVIRFGSIVLITNPIWHKVYYKSRYGSYWNTNYAQNYFTIPYGKDDIKIGLKGKEIYIADGIQIGLGIVGLSYLEYKY